MVSIVTGIDQAVMSVLWHLTHVFYLCRMKFTWYTLEDDSLLSIQQRIKFLAGCHGCHWLLRLPISIVMMTDKAVLWHLQHVFDVGRMKFIQYSLKGYSLLPIEQRIPFLVGCPHYFLRYCNAIRIAITMGSLH